LTVQGLHVLIDHQGRFLPADRSGLETELAYPYSDFDIFEFAIRQAGWLELRCEPDETQAHLRFDCFSLADKALTAAGAFLLKPKLNDVSFRYHLCGEQFERFTDGIQASRRLLRLWKISCTALRPPTVICQARDANDLHAQKHPAAKRLSRLLDLWREKNGVFDQDIVPFLRRHELLDRTLLIEPASNGEDVVFTFIGRGFTLYGPDWPQTGIGQAVNRQPDPSYGQWAAKSAAVIMASGVPQFEEISARIRTPHGWPRRSRYKCLRLLWQTTAGHPVVMTTSLLTPDVDVPLVA
jgi:hypothetical protein